jgi:hypothetical protein
VDDVFGSFEAFQMVFRAGGLEQLNQTFIFIFTIQSGFGVFHKRYPPGGSLSPDPGHYITERISYLAIKN